MRITLILLLISLAVLMGYSASHYKAPEIQAEIQADIEGRIVAELDKIEPASEITIDIDGRQVTLRGVAPDEAAKDAIIEHVREVWGALEPIDEIEITSLKGLPSHPSPKAKMLAGLAS